MDLAEREKISRDYFWNTVGSAVYALSSMVLAFTTMRFAGPDDGGVFGFGYSTLGQQMFIIAYFGIRPFHITDTRREYSYSDYLRLRLITSAGAVIIACIFLLAMFTLGRYTARKALILMLLAGLKIFDGIADLSESECQRIGKLYIAGIALTVRTLCFAAVLAAVLILSGNIIAAASAALAVQFAGVCILKRYLERRLLPDFYGQTARKCENDMHEAGSAHISEPGARGGIRSLAGSTSLIFMSAFLDFYVFSASKYAVDMFMTDADNGIFNLLFMPTSVIYLAANFIIRPYMSRLSADYDKGDIAEFEQKIRNLGKFILALAAAGVLGALLLGGPVLKLAELILGGAYTGKLAQRHAAFTLIILGGSFYALTNLYYYVLIIMRRQKNIFFGYILMTAVSLGISSVSVRIAGLNGAAAGYAAYMMIMTAVFLCSEKAAAAKIRTGGRGYR